MSMGLGIRRRRKHAPIFVVIFIIVLDIVFIITAASTKAVIDITP